MAIIRFSDEEVFGTDSQEYEILSDAAMRIKDVPGAIVEIGTRRGGSAKIIMDSLDAIGETQRPFFCIDPYGNIEYPETNKAISLFNPDFELEGDRESPDINVNIRRDYDNAMRNRIIPSLYFYAYNKGFDFTFFCLEDTEFFARYADGVPIYNINKKLINEYAFVFFDGPHTNECIETELNFFLERSVPGSVFVFDDYWMMDHDRVVEEKLFPLGWKTINKGQIKASYQRTV